MNKINQQFKTEDYSFCLFRIPEKGARVIWEITNSCNYPCGYCIFSSEKGIIPGELSTEEVFRMLDGLKSKDFTHIKFTGGEPFIRKDFMNILKQSTDMGFIVDVSTNASIIDASKALELKKYCLSMIHVSVDGHNQDVHEQVRGKNTYNRTIRGLKHLVNNNLYTRIGTVIFKGNENYLEEMVRSAVNLGSNEVIFSFMEPVGRMKEHQIDVSQRSIGDVKAELDQLATVYAPKIKVNYSFTENPKMFESGICPAISKFLYIDNFGRVSPCTWVVANNSQYMSQKTIKNATFEDIINSEPIRSYLNHVNELSQNGYKGCPVRMRK
ncbi:MAG: radical SAM/SPASM domain-containing protein [Candidatus Woesearchaeota archaeon]